LDDAGADGKITLKCILENKLNKNWTEFNWIFTESTGRALRKGHTEKFITQMSEHQNFKIHSAARS